MMRNFGAIASVVVTAGFVAFACTSGEVVDGPLSGNGGSGNVAGTGSGNTVGQAGTQGQAGRGGTTGTGNTVGQAGTTGRGGTTGTGNTVGQAGTTGRGGTTGTGNTSGVAGTTGTGNTAGVAGTTGSGGSIGVTCGAALEASADGFVRAPAAGGGCWHGYSFAGGDTGSTITPKDFSTCGTPCMLKMSGTVGPATMANSYVGVAYIGFNLGQDNGATTVPTVTPTGTGVTVTFSATTATLPLRAQLSGTGSTFWCFNITGASPQTIPYGMFNTACWDNSGTAYAKQPITNFELVVPGGAAATPGVSVQISNLKEN